MIPQRPYRFFLSTYILTYCPSAVTNTMSTNTNPTIDQGLRNQLTGSFPTIAPTIVRVTSVNAVASLDVGSILRTGNLEQLDFDHPSFDLQQALNVVDAPNSALVDRETQLDTFIDQINHFPPFKTRQEYEELSEGSPKRVYDETLGAYVTFTNALMDLVAVYQEPSTEGLARRDSAISLTPLQLLPSSAKTHNLALNRAERLRDLSLDNVTTLISHLPAPDGNLRQTCEELAKSVQEIRNTIRAMKGELFDREDTEGDAAIADNKVERSAFDKATERITDLQGKVTSLLQTREARSQDLLSDTVLGRMLESSLDRAVFWQKALGVRTSNMGRFHELSEYDDVDADLIDRMESVTLN